MTRIKLRMVLTISCSALAAFAAGCSGTEIPPIRGLESVAKVGTAMLNAPSFTEAEELSLAREQAKKIEENNNIWDDPLLEAYLAQLTQKIVAVAKPRPWRYRVKIINHSRVNAFTPGGGLVYITRASSHGWKARCSSRWSPLTRLPT
jgi:predicted Zn-dependent protease